MTLEGVLLFKHVFFNLIVSKTHVYRDGRILSFVIPDTDFSGKRSLLSTDTDRRTSTLVSLRTVQESSRGALVVLSRLKSINTNLSVYL